MGWQFWIDRGGTFTDVVARCPDGTTLTHKLLSDSPRQYDDAAIAAIRALMRVPEGEAIPFDEIDAVKMGTTVATNALLEREGARTALVMTAGFADALRIGYQARPDIFALDIVLPEMMYAAVVEAQERVSATGDVLHALDLEALRPKLEALRDDGFVSVAIALMHGYRYPAHEQAIGALAVELGFEQVSMSHVVSPLMKLIPRGDTTVVDAYLSPVLRRYVRQVESALQPPSGSSSTSAPRLMFMQSSGGLCDARSFQGKDALLSGPAGGVVGMVRTATAAGLTRLLGFDMGGTSTDVSHYAGELERTYETQVAGVRVRAPMIHIHTVAAGGGSLLRFDGHRLRVGPESAGANPGPTAYRNDGPLCVTDCNVLLGKIRAEYFPSVFGPSGDEALDTAAVRRKFELLAAEVSTRTGVPQSSEALAEGFITVAVENMANAIKKISVQRGYDVSRYALVCFGGAGGQHACLVADRLGVSKVYIHPQAGVLSALGIGLADVRDVRDAAVNAPLGDALLAQLTPTWASLESASRAVIEAQGAVVSRVNRRVALRYAGSDLAIHVKDGSVQELTRHFEETHQARFGFISPEKSLVVESLQVESASESDASAGTIRDAAPILHEAVEHSVTMAGRSGPAAFVERRSLAEGASLSGPAVLLEATATTVVEPGWKATALGGGELLLERETALPSRVALGTHVDPVQLEIFNMLFMNIAEQMGVVLENTASSVNIKERLDFSCAVFDAGGDLVANAPHMPVHLGSMSESIKSVIRDCTMRPGSVFMMNAPYNGGTHLPDITVIKPVFLHGGDAPVFFVASRGHHADIGGTAAGSAPADSTHVDEEGVLLDNVLLVDNERFLLDEVSALLREARYPARNPEQNIADLKAQVAACERGSKELLRVIDYYGLDVVHAYMGHVKDNAEECVRQVIDALSDGEFVCEMDDGHSVKVAITVDHESRSATIDFRGTSGTHPGNYNAPSAIAHAAVLYVFRCLVDDDIPLNAGCMKPLRLLLPPDSMIDPRYPAAVIAGNVETSQVIVDALFGALGVMGAAQGTMNNLFWGNDKHQYYETICGGAGATPRADGCSAVHTHMTNSRLTDPEVLEWRFPVVLEEFSLRAGSGGEGQQRGGDGVVRRLRFEEAMEVNVLSGRRRVPPYGMAGGQPGAVGHSRKIALDGTVTDFPAAAKTRVEPGERFEIETPGGGGFGTPE